MFDSKSFLDPRLLCLCTIEVYANCNIQLPSLVPQNPRSHIKKLSFQAPKLLLSVPNLASKESLANYGCLVCTFLQSGSNKSRFVIPGSKTLAQCSYTPWIPPMIDHEMLHGTKVYIACTSTDFYCIFNRISDGQFLARSATGCVYIYLT